MPCDVANVIIDNCSSCHGAPPSNGAPMRMLTYEDLTAASPHDLTRSVAQAAIDRMRNAKTPMPPTGALPESDIAILEAWVRAGTPRGTCASPVGDRPGAIAYDTPSVCTSNTRWTGGDHGSPMMHPGAACIACHARGDARGDDQGEVPAFTAAGTLYPTAHEPDDCNGTEGPNAHVVITDALGKTYALPVNGAGNFFTTTPLASPYRAKVVSGTRTREMAAPQTSGDCNGCHTRSGNQQAPGRVMAP
jgi:cytochrome c553